MPRLATGPTLVWPFAGTPYRPNEPYKWRGQGKHYAINMAASGERQGRLLAVTPRIWGPLNWNQQVNSIETFELLRDFYEFHVYPELRTFSWLDPDDAMTWGQNDPTGRTSSVVQYGVGDGRAKNFRAPFSGDPDGRLYSRAASTDPWAPDGTAGVSPGTGGFGCSRITFGDGSEPTPGTLLGVGFTGSRAWPARFVEEFCEVQRYSSTTWTVSLTVQEVINELFLSQPTGPWGSGAWALTSVGSGDTAKLSDGDLSTPAGDFTPAADSKIRLDTSTGREFCQLAVYTTNGYSAAWVVEYSNDATTWVEVDYYPVSPIGPAAAPVGALFEWFPAGAHRYWRLRKGSGGSQVYVITELAWFETFS